MGAAEVTMQAGERGSTKTVAIRSQDVQCLEGDQPSLVTGMISRTRQKRQHNCEIFSVYSGDAMWVQKKALVKVPETGVPEGERGARGRD